MSSWCDGRWRVLLAFILWLSPAVVSADSVTLAWDPSAGATGYTVRWGTAVGSYPNSADAGSGTTFDITGLTAGATYWTVVQAYNDSGVSQFSTPLQFTVPGAPAPCTYSIGPGSVSIPAAATSGTISVTTQSGCAWSATSTSGFLTFENGTGRTGPGSVGFTVAANTATSPRTGTASVAGQPFSVSQAAAAPACSYSINPASVSVAAAASSGTITVTTQTGCAWNATSASGFLTFQNGTGRTGSGSVGFTVAANTATSLRTGTATVADKTFTVSQAAAAPQACTYAINPATIGMAAAGGAGTIVVTTQTGCAWTATSFSAFMTFQNGAGRTGPGSVEFTVAASTATTARTGIGTVAGKSFTLSQAGTTVSCTYSISPPNISTSAAASNGTINVTTQTGCGWNANSMSTFVTFQNGIARTGSGSVEFAVAANTTTTPRTGIASVASATFYVAQAASSAEAPGPSGASWSSDFDGDGKNDLLVHDSVGGSVEAWFLDGATVKGTQSLSHSMDVNWKLVGRGDFNADRKPDLVWQHKSDGRMSIWYMDGTARIGETAPSISQVADPRWQVVGVGDFSADGKPDLLWQHTADGALVVWLMTGVTVTGTVSLAPDRAGDLLWKAVGVGDFNNDGKSDVLWRHLGRGELGVWLMNGLSRIIHSTLTPLSVTDQQWQIGAVIDANGDGKPDLIWEHADGTIMIWHMNGTSRTTYPIIPSTVPMGWNVVGPK